MKTLLLYLRSIFPSWRFFETVNPIPVISYRWISAEGSQDQEWKLLPFDNLPRGFKTLFYNPDGNLHFTYQVQLEQFLMDLSTCPEEQLQFYQNFTTFKITKAIIKKILQEIHPSTHLRFQFKVGVYEFLKGDKVEKQYSDVFISAPMEL